MEEREKMMKRAGRKMSFCMGITLSFFLSLVGMGTSGHFTVQGWIVSFLISAIVSLVIGFFVPMKKVTEGAVAKAGLTPGKFGTKCYESLISDLIYTPIITFLMVLLAYMNIRRNLPPEAPGPSFLPMFLSSLVICMIVGFVLIYIFTPIYMKLVIGNPQGGARTEQTE